MSWSEEVLVYSEKGQQCDWISHIRVAMYSGQLKPTDVGEFRKGDHHTVIHKFKLHTK